MKTNIAKDILQAFKKKISRKNTAEKICVDKVTEYGKLSKNLQGKKH